MDTNQVVQKILNDAKSAADKIKAEADEKLNNLNAANQQTLSNYENETKRLCEKARAESEERILAQARMSALREETEAKRSLLNKVIEKSGQTIKTMNDADYLNLIEGLIQACVKTGNEEIVIGSKEKRINEDFVGRINKKLAEKGKLKLALDKTDMEAGFILREGKRRINASLDVLLKVAAQQLEGKLSQELFG
ncbi:MAG: V-type ATP synthase subunit E [Phycisphaerales bacterium]